MLLIGKVGGYGFSLLLGYHSREMEDYKLLWIISSIWKFPVLNINHAAVVISAPDTESPS